MDPQFDVGQVVLSKVEERLSPEVTSDIEKMVSNMLNDIREVSGYHTVLSEISLYFKIDAYDRIWLMHCSRVAIRSS